ncbi:pyruvate ferredoxin oxidoreductase [Thermodesulforhabdus norvegica]|uniref:Pyruvate ferredoxin oxidoreductase alpha subunit n=1 Tax=Thermodesulforhabdus norvegica TaxID=39841 RepID=A0A1I4VQZ2_9BACT|nr:pyruvate ferredoxin oxidoreductase [Thermodesulforhabdus norvegica]SFN03553.1 pyruvate ferredoxin oxidoreductase alpha subunit [Thermodesulforhabdus norvegica]
MKKVVEGSHAVSEAVRLARAEVISAYPITPQTHIVELLSEYCASGVMKAKFLRVESEHSALAALIGAASAGCRTFTATSSQGLAYMHELLHWAAGARLPIVMAVVNRALAPGWNIWTEQTDTLSQRDTGWIQLYCEDGQEALDTTLIAYRLAESIYLPVMVILDAFFLSHTYEPVDIPDQEEVDRYLPPFEPAFKLDLANPCAFNQLAPPNVYMEMRYSMHEAALRARDEYLEAERSFREAFERSYGIVEPVFCDDAEIIMVTSGTVTSTCRLVVDELRSRGERVGLLKIKMFRPFPADDVTRCLRKASKVAVIDRNISFGASGIFAQEIRAALCNDPNRPLVFGYVAGLGGRDITEEVLFEIYEDTKKKDRPERPDIWIGLRQEVLA